MKRAHGTGSKTPLPDGRIWVRGPRQPDGSRPSMGYVRTQEEADLLLNGAVHALRTAKKDGAPLFADWVSHVLDVREADGIRGIDQERRRAKTHLVPHLGQRRIDAIRPADILEWVRTVQRKDAQDSRGKRKIDRSTVTRCLALASVIFQEAVGVHIDANPCTGIRVKRDARVDEDEEREEAWDWLRRDEQLLFLACEEIPAEARRLVAFAWGTGLRQGEQWHLKIGDVHVDGPNPYVFVRVGSKGKRPKSGKTRRVALFGDALAAAKEQIAALNGRPNEHGLLWPTSTGLRRAPGAPEKSVRRDGKVCKVELLPTWLRAAGIQRDLRWHDLRHTFCSSLVSGSWGAAWTLEEVRDAAGHSSVTVTEKYAHLCETTQQKAVARMVGTAGLEPATLGLKGPCATIAPRPRIGSRLVGGASSDAAIVNENANLADSPEAVTRALKGHGVLELLRELASENAPHNPLVTNLAAALASALKAGVS